MNRKKIAELEALAKTIYDYWFVQFDFPDANGKPYKTSGGKMQFASTLGRDIPLEWLPCSLGDVVEINKQSYRSSALPDVINYFDISSIQHGEIKKPCICSHDEAPGRARRIVKDGDIVWSCVRPNLKAFALILSPSENDVFSTGFAVLSPTRIPYGYLYCLTSTENFVNYLVSKTGNSAYPAVLPQDFKAYTFAMPPNILLDRYHQFVDPIFRQRQRCYEEIRELETSRDTLLPLLMNGQVKVAG